MIGKRLKEKPEWKYIRIVVIVIAVIFIAAIIVSFLTPESDYTTFEKEGKKGPVVKEFTEKRLVRISEVGWLGGVLAGLAYHFSIPLWLFRLLFVVAIAWTDDFGEFLITAYIILWLFMPEIDFIPADFAAVTGG